MLPARPTSIDDGFTRRAARARLAPHPRPRRFGSKAAADAIHEVVEIEVLESSLAKDPDDPDDRRNYETVLNYYKAALAQIQRQIPGVVCCGAFETGGCARMGGSVSVAGCRRRGRGFHTGHMARSAIAICRTVTYGRVRLGIDAGAVRTRLGCIRTLARTVVEPRLTPFPPYSASSRLGSAEPSRRPLDPPTGPAAPQLGYGPV